VGIPTRFAQHVYRDSIRYDASERRAALVYPDNSVAAFSYDPVFGNLATIVGPSGKVYSMQYDLSGRLVNQARLSGTADSVYESFGYDDDSRLVRDTVKGAGSYSSTLRTGLVQYDARDKVLNAPNSIAPEAFTYSPLGAVTEGNTMSGAAEEFTVDALGNSYTHEPNGVTSTYNYHAGSTRLDMMLTPNGIYTDTTRYAYDRDGNRLDETTSHYLSDPTPGFTNNCAPVGDALCINTARSYSYNSENLLEQTYVMIDSTITHPGYYPYMTDEHFRYDALGRRVWARMNHSANCSKQKPWGGCFNTLLRSVWDGNQLIYEIQTVADSTASLENDSPSESGSYGIVSYVHGAGLDAPLAIYKGGSLAVLPFVNYRGETDMVVCPVVCSGVPMPGLTDGLNHLDGGTTSGPTGFYGTLQADGKTGSGLVYARNRYVDPETGKFTQADPIGLAGGVNAWGFVGGDPVNYSDPFGLCPGFGDAVPCEAVFASIGAVGGAVIGGTVGAAGGTLVFPGVGTVAGAAGVGLAGAGFGATVGGFIGKITDVFAAQGRTASGGYTDEHGNELGPSGKPKIHEVDSPTRKGAKDAARSAGKGTPVEHPNPTRGNPHFHPTGADGEKIPSSPHFTYPQ
jgi:RHS repeat-associated protein